MADLLPPNSTAQERAISNALDRQIPVLVRHLWDAERCPVELLPWLAWAMSVDEWNSDWTEEQKREAIKASVQVHQQKGTVGAVRTALAALGYDIDLTEWFKMVPTGDPYTFALEVAVDQFGIPNGLDYQSIESVTENTKNLRSRLTAITVRGISRATEFAGVKVIAGETINLFAEPVV